MHTLLVSLPNDAGKRAGAESVRKANIDPKVWDIGRNKQMTESSYYYMIFETEALWMTLCDL